jgi:N-acetylglucosamine malate deacetylase 2
MGTFLAEWRRSCVIVHVTDGAPRSGDDARNAGCATPTEYAGLRRREFDRALNAAGIVSASTVCLECPDQQATWHIADYARFLAGLFEEVASPVVFTHPYEGGHPDHDAAAAAVHAATLLAKNRPGLLEFASYHAGAGGMECERFLQEDGIPVWNRCLTREQHEWKKQVLAQYRSQTRVLAQFPLSREPVRVAPVYDFSRAPHAGTLYYERFDWGVQGDKWRALAGRAFKDLGITCVC